MKRIVLSGGGTAGHINPALALADELKLHDYQVLFAGTFQGIEAQLVPRENIAYQPFHVRGFNRKHPLSLVGALYYAAKARRKAVSWLKAIKPEAVVCFGGYVSLPVGMAAHALHIPLFVHEQNSVMGLTNAHLSKYARKVFLTYQEAASRIPEKTPYDVIGNPVRRSVCEATRKQGRQFLGIDEDAFVLLVTGGSLGAEHINEALCACKEKLLALPKLHVVHITGKKTYEKTCAQLALTPLEKQRWHVFDYQYEMGKCLAAADAIVSRAGATSLAEIAARGLPALLVPYPFATANHQEHNARAACNAGCAFVCLDDKLETEEFSTNVLKLCSDKRVWSAMKAACEKRAATHAREALYSAIIERL